MTAALGSLTARGRTLFFTGVAMLVVAFGLGDLDLGRVAVLFIVLPLMCGVYVRRTRARLSSQRRLTLPRVAAGEVVEVHIRVENASRWRTGVLLAEDTVPVVFGGRPRFVLDRLSAASAVDVHYPVRCAVRGRYRIGPLALRLRDPFGLAEQSRTFEEVDELVVTPRIQPLPAVRITGEWAGLGESTRRSVASAGEDDASIREYRLGDDLRRVHWRSTARLGELMVRREEQPWQSRAAVLLDTRALAHAGEGAASSLEWAVSAAASISSHLSDRGFEQRLVYDTGAAVASSRSSAAWVDLLLDNLAGCSPSRSSTLAPGLASLRHGGGEGLVVAIVAALERADVEDMIRARGRGVTSVALLVDTATWRGGRPRGSDLARLLAAAGWRVVTAERGADLAEVWRRVGSEQHGGGMPTVVGGGAPVSAAARSPA